MQRSPTFLAPETGFVEDGFSMDVGGGWDGSGGNASDGGAASDGLGGKASDRE